MTSELLPETVTVVGLENRSMMTGIITLTATLASEVVRRLYDALKRGSRATLRSSSSPRIHSSVNWIPTSKMKL